ncbi:hypothetical protein BDD12DRAFT_379615 [Trichophaea hybrida]|nr:hypothetical protein BDD12DRAFT_379615 [Trichophaea hybrida]
MGRRPSVISAKLAIPILLQARTKLISITRITPSLLPRQLNKFLIPKSLAAFKVVGGILGMEKGLQKDLAADPSIDDLFKPTTTARRAPHAHDPEDDFYSYARIRMLPPPPPPPTLTPTSHFFRYTSLFRGLVSGALRHGGKFVGKAAALATRQSSGIRGLIDGHVKSLVFADNGSDRNIMKQDYTQRHGIVIDKSPQARAKVPLPQKGKYLHIIGRTTVSWTFDDNPYQIYRLKFDVVSSCAHDVIVGKQFLDQTKSLTDNNHRLIAMPPRPPGSNLVSIKSIGESHDKITMLVSGKRGRKFRAHCLPDIGAEGEVISEEFAKRHKFKLEHSDTIFEFADGTTDDSLGCVRLDMFFEDAPEKQISRYLEVMRDGQHDIILSHQFVFEHNLFSRKLLGLISVTGRLGLNAIAFLRKWRQDADPAVRSGIANIKPLPWKRVT